MDESATGSVNFFLCTDRRTTMIIARVGTSSSACAREGKCEMTVRGAALLGIGGDGRRRNRTAELLPTMRQEPTPEKRASIAEPEGRSCDDILRPT